MSTENELPVQETQATTPAPAQPAARPFSGRGFTSLLLTLAFLVMAFSGILVFLTPRGRTANWTDWSLLGLGKEEWGALHTNAAILFLVISIVHLVFNWKMFMGYLKKKAVAGVHMAKELTLATVLMLIVVVGTIVNIAPFSSIVALHDDIKDYWEQNAPAAPAPHADEFTLAEFATQIQLSMEDVTKALEEEGYQIDGSEITIAELGQQKDAPASQVMADIRKHFPAQGGGQGRGFGGGMGPGAGMGGGMGGGGGMGPGGGMGRGMGRGAGMGPGAGNHE